MKRNTSHTNKTDAIDSSGTRVGKVLRWLNQQHSQEPSFIRVAINHLPTNDAHMRHGTSISSKNLYGEFNTRRYTSVHGFCFF